MGLSFDDVGLGKPVVLLHAFPLGRSLWRPQVEALAGSCRLLMPDLPGFGDSPLPEPPTVEAMADAVAAFLEERAVGEPVVLGGLSMGGYVALAFARKYAGRLRGLILADTRAEADDEAARVNRDKQIALAESEGSAAVLAMMLPRLLTPRTHATRPEVVEEVRRMAAAQRPEGVAAALRAMRDRPDAGGVLDGLRVPALVLVGREDVVTPPAVAERMAARVANARLVVLPEAGHLANLEQAGRFGETVRAFVEGVA
jgi:pimeloyl-ACP methyl ester carboxylesterase